MTTDTGPEQGDGELQDLQQIPGLFTRLSPAVVEMITMVDVSEERRLAAREHELAVRLQRSMLGRIDTAPGVDVSVTYRPAEIDQRGCSACRPRCCSTEPAQWRVCARPSRRGT